MVISFEKSSVLILILMLHWVGSQMGETVEGKIQICKEQVRGLIERNYSSESSPFDTFASQAPYKKALESPRFSGPSVTGRV